MLSLHESNEVVHTIRNLIIRQTLEEQLSVRLGLEPVVEDREDSTVGPGADQTAQSLFQAQHCIRNLIVRERAAAIFFNVRRSSGDQRIARNLKRQLVDDYRAQRLSLHVDAL